MFMHLFRFELRYWLRQPIVYIFFLVNALLVFGATVSNNITIGGSTGNVLKNAPYVVENYYALFSLISLLMITTFFNNAAARDFNLKTSQILFSTPIRKHDFLLARFSGALVISIIPFLGVSAGNLIGGMMPWMDDNQIGPVYWLAHINGLLVFTIPNLMFSGAIIFGISALTRNTMLSFTGSMALLVAYTISLTLIADIQNEMLGAMIDPFGLRTFSVTTKYWTVDERNTLTIGFESLLLLNRVIWFSVGTILFAITWVRFSFSEKSTSRKRKIEEEAGTTEIMWGTLTRVKPETSSLWAFRQMISQIRIETIFIVKNLAFVLIMLFAAINLLSNLSLATSQGYGNTAFPVTYNIVDIIRGSWNVFILAVITFYSGAIVWKERESSVQDIYDSLPYPDWLLVVSKTLAMYLAVLILIFIGVCMGVATQLLNGFTDLRPEVYLVELLVSDGLTFLCTIILSIFIHSLVNNRYLGYFIFISVLIANEFIWPALDISSNMVIFAAAPGLIYSDMNAFGPFLYGHMAFKWYWVLAGAVMIGLALLFWVRGREQHIRIRSRTAWNRVDTYRPLLLILFSIWLVCGGWLFYHTNVLNSFKTPDEAEKIMADYEKLYKRYEGRHQPRIISLDYHIELYPEKRGLEVSCKQRVKNKGTSSIDTLFLTYSTLYKSLINLPGSALLLNDTSLGFAMYKLAKPIMPGESLDMTMTMSYYPTGIENEVNNSSIVDNGSFFNNNTILPQIGYQAGFELSDRKDRKEYGLPMKDRMPRLSNQPAKRMNNLISNNSDWVHVRSIFGTSGDQIAIAPGSLRRQWKKNGRNYYHYELDHPSMNFYSFMSARYQVRKKMYKGISLEVYYDARHAYNVNKMMMSMEKSIDYYDSNFGPYRHKQARIIEFPRYASFAQAFPGTMPYSESIGFIANLEDQEDIDMVTYIVAHEMGHQWWGHQVVGPEMQGSTMLSESMAQYSALMVMEKMYGKDQMHKFLRYEMDRYLSARGLEAEKELPLLEAETQAYMYYNKASTVVFYLKEMIGEERVNAALKNLVDSFAYREPPYPTAYELVNRLETQTPDSLRYLINDLFRNITIFDNKVVEAKTRKITNAYETTITVRANKMYADTVGRETPTVLDDWIMVGLLAKPVQGKKYGKPIEMRKFRMRDKDATFVLTTKEKPWQAGIDPYCYLVDRMPEDNLKRVSDQE